MSTTVCQHCKTYDGVTEQRSFNGRKRKPLICPNHQRPFATCDVCGVVSSISTHSRTGYEGRRTFSVYSHTEAFGGPWQDLPVGVALETYGLRNEYVKDKKVHVCAECADVVRKAMQVAFDQCVAARAGSRGGVVLDAATPNRVIVAPENAPTVTMTKTVTQ